MCTNTIMSSPSAVLDICLMKCRISAQSTFWMIGLVQQEKDLGHFYYSDCTEDQPQDIPPKTYRQQGMGASYILQKRNISRIRSPEDKATFHDAAKRFPGETHIYYVTNVLCFLEGAKLVPSGTYAICRSDVLEDARAEALSQYSTVPRRTQLLGSGRRASAIDQPVAQSPRLNTFIADVPPLDPTVSPVTMPMRIRDQQARRLEYDLNNSRGIPGNTTTLQIPAALRELNPSAIPTRPDRGVRRTESINDSPAISPPNVFGPLTTIPSLGTPETTTSTSNGTSLGSESSSSPRSRPVTERSAWTSTPGSTRDSTPAGSLAGPSPPSNSPATPRGARLAVFGERRWRSDMATSPLRSPGGHPRNPGAGGNENR